MSEHASPAGRSWLVLGRLMRVHVAVYRATGGRVGHRVPGLPPLLLLDHVGAKSGKRRTTPLAYMPYEESLIVVGARFGHSRNPSWVHNLRAFPDTKIQVGPDIIKVRAREAAAGENKRLWPEAARYNPAWARFQKRTERAFPLLILTPRRI
jgi:F420H(2)-dependent quinone reductase